MSITCSGCGQGFAGLRGLSSHQSGRYVTLACRPRYEIRRAHSPAGPSGWDLFYDGEWANRFPVRDDARDALIELLSA